MAVLFTFGIGENGTAKVRPDANGQLNIYADGCSNVLGMIDIGRIRSIPYMIYGPNTQQPPLRIPVRPSLVFNQISEPESHQCALERCVDLCRQLGVPVINHPENVMETARHKVAERLGDIPGAIVPRTILLEPRSPGDVLAAAEENGISFPFIFRTVGEHNGHNMELISDAGEIGKLHGFAFDGSRFFLIEFIDYAEENGLYRKHRIVAIDGEFFPHHSSFHELWKVHVLHNKGLEFMASRPDMGTHEENFFHLKDHLIPGAMPVLEEIYRQVGLDYFALDCHVREDGRVVVFEANASVNALEGAFESLKPYYDRIRDRMVRLISERSGETV